MIFFIVFYLRPCYNRVAFLFSLVPGLVWKIAGLFYFLGTRIFQLISPFSLCPHWLEWFGRFRLFVSRVPLLMVI
nr:MAG TPA: hypothetical protein [Herelleviridae sp.]